MASQGPLSPGSIVNNLSAGGVAWSNPGNALASDDAYATVTLLKPDLELSDNRATATLWPASDTYVSYGGPADLWGRTWTPEEINDSNFGVAISAQFAGTASVDHIRITVTYTEPALAGSQEIGFNLGVGLG